MPVRNTDSATPAVSVVVAAYGYGRYLDDALASALAQEYKGGFEVLVVHRPAHDETEEVLARFAVDRRVRIIEQEGAGLARAANQGLAAARGRYVLRLDADDRFLPGIIATEASYLDTHPHVGFVYPDYFYLLEPTRDRPDKTFPERRLKHLPDFDPAELTTRGDFLSGGAMFRKSLLVEVGGYDESLPTLESYELILRLLKRSVRGHHIPEPLFEYRIHGASLSDDSAATESAALAIAERHGIAYTRGEHHPRRWESADGE